MTEYTRLCADADPAQIWDCHCPCAGNNHGGGPYDWAPFDNYGIIREGGYTQQSYTVSLIDEPLISCHGPGLKVYLAGKIAPHEGDWRKDLIVDVASYSPDGYRLGDYNDPVTSEVWPPREGAMGVTITGPFFIEGEGHDGMHSEGSHGFGDTDGSGGWFENLPPERRHIVSRLCRQAIQDSDVILVWLGDQDALTAYGTVWEAGYAASLGKKVVVALRPHQTKTQIADDGPVYRPEKCTDDCVEHALWFLVENADAVVRCTTPTEAMAQVVRSRLRVV